MKIRGKHYRTIWLSEDDPSVVCVIDQRKLPFTFEVKELCSLEDIFLAIRDMVVRGAPLIGVTAAFGLYLAALKSTRLEFRRQVFSAGDYLKSARPTAVNLAYAVDLLLNSLDTGLTREQGIRKLLKMAQNLAEKEVDRCRMIGEHGLKVISELYAMKGRTVHVLTHCNAGWLACIDIGTATAPVYMAHDAGIPVHVWVDETRPRNQGARLTAFELAEHGVPHTVIVDNAGGHLMQEGKVDLVIVGSDRTTRKGDVANKIGTYLKAVAARDCKVPFYVAVPTSSIDLDMQDSSKMDIEERDSREVTHLTGWNEQTNASEELMMVPRGTRVVNPSFDITPARLVTGLITEFGISEANETGILEIFRRKKEADRSN